MDMFLPPVSGSNYPDINPAAGSVQGKPDAAQEVTTVFMQNMLKEIFKGQMNNDLYSDGSGAYGMNPYLSDILTEQMIAELSKADVFGFKKLINEKTDLER